LIYSSCFGFLVHDGSKLILWGNLSFHSSRRAYLGKGHGGQRRAFKVKFLGEGVNDYGGPYRAVFEQIVDELQNDRLPLGQKVGDRCLLPLLVPCPNRSSAVGFNQEKFVLNPGSASPFTLELIQFLGKTVGMGVRHGLPMGLDLSSNLWKPLVGTHLSRYMLPLCLLSFLSLFSIRFHGSCQYPNLLGSVLSLFFGVNYRGNFDIKSRFETKDKKSRARQGSF